jgi:SAM-dependent methyltransferase
MSRRPPEKDRPRGPVRDPASYRDPAGFVFERDGVLYRQIAPSFADDWDAFEASGLAARLAAEGLLVPHEEADPALAAEPGAYRVIRPERVVFVSYPYEWSFSQLKDAALLTLRSQVLANESGMTLRDASAYNVQFRGAQPVLIDSLSFERATPGAPWAAYRQFCEHFLAPLALMAHVDVRLGSLLKGHLEGVPLDLAARLLPARTRLSFGLGPHIHLHARAQRRYATRPEAAGEGGDGARLSSSRQSTLLESLRSAVAGLAWRPEGTEWADYADRTSYDEAATEAKVHAVTQALFAAGGRRVWDLGANTGRYSRVAADLGRSVVAFDIDPAAVERAYLALRTEGRTDILPLLADLTAPSPDNGWANAERRSLLARADADVVLALALVHHLAIGRNVPLPFVAALFARLAGDAIVEFVPKDDPMVRRLLAARRDVFPGYSIEGFRSAVAPHFAIASETPIAGTSRTLFHLRRHR